MLFSTILALISLIVGLSSPLDSDNSKRDGVTIPQSFSRTTTTSGGIEYPVYFHNATVPSRPTLFFVRGFPQASFHWRYQDEFSRALTKGYAVVVPESLGYVGMDEPMYGESYAVMVDVLDSLEIHGPVIVVGHDWGTKAESRLALDHDENFQVSAFYEHGYLEWCVGLKLRRVFKSLGFLFGPVYFVFLYKLFDYLKLQ